MITSSGALVTLLFGLAALVTNAKGFQLPMEGRDVLVWGLRAFITAAFLGLATNVPIAYKEVTPDSLLNALNDPQTRTESIIDATVDTGEALILTLRSYRKKNGIKAWIVTAALVAEAIGAAAVAQVVYLILRP